MKRLFFLTSLMLFCKSLLAQQTGSITDERDGKIYKTVVMQSGRSGSTKIWMAENLASVKFRNGDPITEAKNFNEWLVLYTSGKPAYCYYDYDASNKSYGILYNLHAVNDKRGLAPKGWSVANTMDWQSIQHYGEYELEDGNFAKDHSDLMSSEWNKFDGSPNVENRSNFNPTNKTGFNPIPNGYLTGGQFLPYVFEACWWAVNEKKEAFTVSMSADQPFLHFNPELKSGVKNTNYYEYAYPVRCVKN